MSPKAHESPISTVLDEATLVDQLNTLLSFLSIPITLISPTDLTPSLLIAILESVQGRRIPLIDRNKNSKNSKASKIQNMKVFLGVLELDVLKTDVGLSDIDPRRLADGEWEEIFFVGELLCWMGRKLGFIEKVNNQIKQTRADVPPVSKPTLQPDIRLQSSKSQLDLDAESLFQTASTFTESTRPSQLIFSPFIQGASTDSFTSFNTISGDRQGDTHLDDVYPDDVSDLLADLPPFSKSTRPPPNYIHEVPSCSLLFSGDFSQCPPRSSGLPQCNQSSPPFNRTCSCPNCDPSIARTFQNRHDHSVDHSRTSVRYSGFIEPVDEESELASFESSRSILSDIHSPRSQRSVKIESIKEQYTRTQELLNQRAQLLSQLAELKNVYR